MKSDKLKNDELRDICESIIPGLDWQVDGDAADRCGAVRALVAPLGRSCVQVLQFEEQTYHNLSKFTTSVRVSRSKEPILYSRRHLSVEEAFDEILDRATLVGELIDARNRSLSDATMTSRDDDVVFRDTKCVEVQKALL